MIQQKPPQFAVAFLRAIRFATQAPFVAFYRQRKNRAPRDAVLITALFRYSFTVTL